MTRDRTHFVGDDCPGGHQIDIGPSDEERARMKAEILGRLGITDPAVRHAADAYADTVDRLTSRAHQSVCCHAGGFVVDVTLAEQPPRTMLVWSCCGREAT